MYRGFAVASFCIGGLIGGLTAGSIQTKLGRRHAIILNNIGYIVGGILIGTSVHESMFILGRIFCGLGCGMGSLSIPTYIGEVSTIKARGSMGTCNQFFIVVGILLSSVIGLPLANVPLWRVNFAIVVIPAIAQLFLMNTCVETPRYLISVNRIEEARSALQKLRGNCDIEDELYGMVEGHFGTAAAQSLKIHNRSSEDLEKDGVVEMKEDVASPVKNVETGSTAAASEHELLASRKAPSNQDDNEVTLEYDMNGQIVIPAVHHESMNIIQVFKDPLIRRISFTVILLHAFQQLVGINAVMYYSTTIFQLAFTDDMAKYMAIITTAVNFVMTAGAVALIDSMGRRPLLLIANAGACLFSVLLVVGYVYNVPILLVVSVFMYVASFAIGIGPIPWLLTSEITPIYASSSVGAIATATNWAMNFLIGQCFPIVFARIAGYSFAIFAIVAAISFGYVMLFLPETKGKSLEEVVSGFEKRSK